MYRKVNRIYIHPIMIILTTIQAPRGIWLNSECFCYYRQTFDVEYREVTNVKSGRVLKVKMPPRKGKKTSKKNERKEKDKTSFVDLTDLFSNFSEPKQEEYRMHFLDLRRESFRNWPFDEAADCNPSTVQFIASMNLLTFESEILICKFAEL